MHRPSRVAGPRRVLLAVAAASLLATGCAARFERPEPGTVAIDDGSGLVTDPGTGLPVEPDTGLSSATTGPGASAGPSASPGVGTGSGATSGPSGGPGATAGPTTGPGTVTVSPGRRTGISASTIKVAYLIPKTGAAAVPPQVDQGIRAYWDWLRGRGGILGRNVQVTIYDTESNEQVARERAQDAIDDGNFTVVALDRLGVQAAIGKYLDDRDVPNIMVQTPVNLPAAQSWTFGITIDHDVQGRMIAQYFRRGLGYTTAAVVYELDNALKPGVAAFEDEAEKVGLTIKYSSQIDGNANDYSGPAGDLARANAQAAWLYMAPIPAGKLSSQADAIGYHPTWFANSVSWNFDIIFAAAGKALAGARAFSPWPPLSDSRTATYQAAYRQLYADPPLDLGIPGWGIGQILAAAFQRAGPDMGQNSFRAAMQSLQLGATSPVDKTPLLWAPLAFGPGVRTGSNQVVTLRESGGRWVLDRNFGSRY